MTDQPALLLESVLVVDDEALVREVTEMLIGDMGGTPLGAKNVSEALQIAQEPPTEITLAIIDYTLPDGSGVELFQKLVAQGMKLPVIFTSGAARIAELEELRKEHAVAFLQKPYNASELQSAIVEISPE